MCALCLQTGTALPHPTADSVKPDQCLVCRTKLRGWLLPDDQLCFQCHETVVNEGLEMARWKQKLKGAGYVV